MQFFLETASSLCLLPKNLLISSWWGLEKIGFCLYHN
mgnify:CR=1 FL=1